MAPQNQPTSKLSFVEMKKKLTADLNQAIEEYNRAKAENEKLQDYPAMDPDEVKKKLAELEQSVKHSKMTMSEVSDGLCNIIEKAIRSIDNN
ncbi:unnamed protein product [Periconia digitata]|uniref:Uncharacterized protein n=1 Tax=Periconia digitata TaxID=1303443 RepID=A0A9W4U4D2_9PLEO|nr:unnamed protein product [Periconia digitata]